jgi:hypothetical protein
MEVWYIKAPSQKDVNQNKKSMRITHEHKKNGVNTNGSHRRPRSCRLDLLLAPS